MAGKVPFKELFEVQSSILEKFGENYRFTPRLEQSMISSSLLDIVFADVFTSHGYSPLTMIVPAKTLRRVSPRKIYSLLLKYLKSQSGINVLQVFSFGLAASLALAKGKVNPLCILTVVVPMTYCFTSR